MEEIVLHHKFIIEHTTKNLYGIKKFLIRKKRRIEKELQKKWKSSRKGKEKKAWRKSPAAWNEVAEGAVKKTKSSNPVWLQVNNPGSITKQSKSWITFIGWRREDQFILPSQHNKQQASKPYYSVDVNGKIHCHCFGNPPAINNSEKGYWWCRKKLPLTASTPFSFLNLINFELFSLFNEL